MGSRLIRSAPYSYIIEMEVILVVITREWIRQNRAFPLLSMGDAVTDFKKNYSGKINAAENMEEMREPIAYYTSISYLDRVLVLEDISLFAKNGEGVLLKFVEETPLDLVLLSRFDKVSNVLLSRVKGVVKYYNDPVTSQFMKVSTGYSTLQEQLEPNSHYYDKVRYMGKLSPKMIYLEKNVKQRRNKDKIMSFVE